MMGMVSSRGLAQQATLRGAEPAVEAENSPDDPLSRVLEPLFFGIDHEPRRRLRQAVRDQKDQLETALAGRSQDVAILPGFCGLGKNSRLVFVLGASIGTESLLALGLDYVQNDQNWNPQQVMQQVLARLDWVEEDQVLAGHRLTLQVQELAARTRLDEISEVCLHLVVAASLYKDYRLLLNELREPLTALRWRMKKARMNPQINAQINPQIDTDLEAFGKSPARPTRRLALAWLEDKPLKGQTAASDPEPEGQTRWPASIRIRWQLSEAVFGRGLAGTRASVQAQGGQSPLQEAAVVFDPRALPNALALPGELLDQLRREQLALVNTEQPAIAATYGAWVYVDKGRAYGLNMRDRLVIEGAGEEGGPIKGHVIGFFGAERGLLSPRGYVISDGAIVFVRQGQSSVRAGQEWRYDTRRFPYDGRP